MMNILITGGAGYIGSHLIKTLQNENYNIIIVDNLSNSFQNSIENTKLIVTDIGSTELLESLMINHQFDMCIHMAGSLSVEESSTNPEKYFQNNTKNSIALINLCLKHNINKFIFSSSSTVYGNDGKLNPINNYGKSKRLIEEHLEKASSLHPNFTFLSLRYFNVAGADQELNLGQNGKSSFHLIKIACEVATSKREHININGRDYNTPDGTCIRDYIHLKDVTRAHLCSITYLKNNKQSHHLNVGSGKGHSVLEVIKRLEIISGKNISMKFTVPREGDASISIAEIDSIKKILNWAPVNSDIDSIIRSAYEWEMSISKRVNI